MDTVLFVNYIIVSYNRRAFLKDYDNDSALIIYSFAFAFAFAFSLDMSKPNFVHGQCMPWRPYKNWDCNGWIGSNFLIRLSVDSMRTSFYIAPLYLHSLVITQSMYSDLYIA